MTPPYLYPPYVASFLVLSIVGLLNATYLTYKHYQKKPLVCPLDHKCDVVTESKWSHLFGIRNELLGLFFFGSQIVTLLIILIHPTYTSQLLLFIRLSCAASFLFSLLLVFIQFKIIKDYCFYCLLSTLIVLLLFLNSWGL